MNITTKLVDTHEVYKKKDINQNDSILNKITEKFVSEKSLDSNSCAEYYSKQKTMISIPNRRIKR